MNVSCIILFIFVVYLIKIYLDGPKIIEEQLRILYIFTFNNSPSLQIKYYYLTLNQLNYIHPNLIKRVRASSFEFHRLIVFNYISKTLGLVCSLFFILNQRNFNAIMLKLRCIEPLISCIFYLYNLLNVTIQNTL